MSRAAVRSMIQGKVETRTRELSVLNAIAGALNRSADVESALTRSLELVAELLGMDSGWVWLLDPETERMYNAASFNLPPYLQEPVQMTGQETCSCIWEFRDGSLRAKNVNVMECSRLRRAVRNNVAAETGGLRYHATIPLSFGERRLGIMNLTGPAWRELTAAELALLDTIAAQVGVAVERARLAEESARLARAEERTRLAREIHDTLAQGLTAIALHVEGALRHVGQKPDLARERLERALATTRENLEEARRSVLNLRATPLAGRSLADALGALGRTLTAETGIRVHLKVTGEDADRPLPLRVEGELYRVAQEALTNVRRHAHAKNVTVTLRIAARRVSLAVRDDGVGFDVEARRNRSRSQEGADGAGSTAGAGAGAIGAPRDCHGLLGMRERAKLLGGRFRLQSAPGEGTLISVSAPLEPAADTSTPEEAA